MQFEKSTEEKELFVRLNAFRALLAVTVLFSHIWGYTGLVFMVPFNKAVTIAVFLFFVLSGYGMMRSFQRKKGYIKSIYCVKIPHLIFMAGMAYVFSAALQWILSIDDRGGDFFLPVGITRFFIVTNWYVYELIAFYILFSIAAVIKNRIVRTAFLFLCSLVAFVVLFYSGLVEAYYNSIFGFAAGVCLGSFDYTRLLKHIGVGLGTGFIILIAAFGMMFVMDKQSIRFALVRNIAAFGALIVLIYVCSCLRIENKPNAYLCRISPELYFYHMPVAHLFARVIENPYIYMLAVICISFILAAVYNVIDTVVHKQWIKWLTLEKG